MILDSFPGVCCGYLCFRNSHLGQISSCIPLPASSLGTECLADPPVAKPRGYWWEQYAREDGRQKCMVTNAGFSPIVYLYMCKVEVRLFSVCQTHTWTYGQKSLFSKVHHICLCVEDTLSPCNERKEGGRKALRLNCWVTFLVFLSHDDSFLRINSAFCATAPYLQNIAVPWGFLYGSSNKYFTNANDWGHPTSLSLLCRQGFGKGKEQEGDQLHAMQQIAGKGSTDLLL